MGGFIPFIHADPCIGDLGPGQSRTVTDPALNINSLWIEFYDDTSPENESHYIKFDLLVIARKYIGPLKSQ